jgi:sugar-specific transcriptional regulator TrmB
MKSRLFLYNQMVDYQRIIQSFTPTVRELAQLWGLSQTAAYYTLRQLEGKGMAVTRIHGNTKSYYAVTAGSRGE